MTSVEQYELDPVDSASFEKYVSSIREEAQRCHRAHRIAFKNNKEVEYDHVSSLHENHRKHIMDKTRERWVRIIERNIGEPPEEIVEIAENKLPFETVSCDYSRSDERIIIENVPFNATLSNKSDLEADSYRVSIIGGSSELFLTKPLLSGCSTNSCERLPELPKFDIDSDEFREYFNNVLYDALPSDDLRKILLYLSDEREGIKINMCEERGRQVVDKRDDCTFNDGTLIAGKPVDRYEVGFDGYCRVYQMYREDKINSELLEASSHATMSNDSTVKKSLTQTLNECYTLKELDKKGYKIKKNWVSQTFKDKVSGVERSDTYIFDVFEKLGPDVKQVREHKTKDIKLIGGVHSGQETIDLVCNTLDNNSPDSIAVELGPLQYHLFRILPQETAMTSELGAAIIKGEELDTPVRPVDRSRLRLLWDIYRTSEQKGKARELVKGSLSSFATDFVMSLKCKIGIKEPEERDTYDNDKGRIAFSNFMGMSRTPGSEEVVINERDEKMADKITSMCDEYGSVTAIVGYSHLDGIQDNIKGEWKEENS